MVDVPDFLIEVISVGVNLMILVVLIIILLYLHENEFLLANNLTVMIIATFRVTVIERLLALIFRMNLPLHGFECDILNFAIFTAVVFIE